MRKIAAIALLSSLFACASGGRSGVVERSFRRPEADEIKLQKLAVVVVAAGPPRVAEDSFAVRGFEPPNLDEAVLVGAEDAETRDALGRALSSQLRASGFEVELIHASNAAPAPEVPTSSTSTPAIAAPAAPAVTPLIAGQTLREVLGKTDADAVLVVRAVPVDAWTVDVGTGTRIETTALGREQVRDYRPERREGRLLIGQAFLFDRATGLRLWTKQAPEYPDDGRLTPKHPFLAFGHAIEPGQPRIADRALAEAAATNFSRAMLTGFPSKKAGSIAARQTLDALDPELERSRQAFLDTGHFILGLDVGHSNQGAELSLTLEGEELAPLDTGAIVPSGLWQIIPRAGYLAAGGTLFRASVPISIGPSSFARTIHRDNPNPDLSNPDDQTVRLTSSGVFGLGVELEVGRWVELGERLTLIPRAGGFGELWSIDAEPDLVLGETQRFRFGGLIGADLWLRSSGALFGRGGLDARIGVDTNGGLFFGLGLSLGVGLVL